MTPERQAEIMEEWKRDVWLMRRDRKQPNDPLYFPPWLRAEIMAAWRRDVKSLCTPIANPRIA